VLAEPTCTLEGTMRPHEPLYLLILIFLAACGGSGPLDDPWGHHDGGSDGGAGQDGQAQQDGEVPTDGITPVLQDKVYAHSPSTLYEVDPNTLVVSVVDDFGWPNGSDQMTDIALDEAGSMVGMTYTDVYAVDKATAVCTHLSSFSGVNFNGMSWVEGVGADPQGKTLIGVNQAGDYVTIDPQTGAQNTVGEYGGSFGSSGDLVYVRGAGVFATAVDATHATDVLVSINAGTGVATLIGETGFADIWGLAYWGGTIFGFTDGGQFITIDPATGLGTLVESTSYQFWGAGVTTIAPIVD
jgi:hypothetical protein